MTRHIRKGCGARFFDLEYNVDVAIRIKCDFSIQVITSRSHSNHFEKPVISGIRSR